MRHEGHHIALAIVRAIGRIAQLSALDRHKPILVVENAGSTDWASATFVGATHDIDLRIVGSGAEVEAAVAAIEARLRDHEFTIAGHIVAEIAVLPGCSVAVPDGMVSKSLTVNALTIRD
ncbi:MAG: hypothetical protein DCF31_04870 [Alphaproteobacteria bacterium]|nr:MAG: hypothetical protein DCF31_04870 [Alphaproteobacteria bacterium]